MKLQKILLVGAMMAGLVPAANAYFVADYGYNVGKATLKVSGECAASQVFNNARYGTIYDVEGGSSIGYGLLDMDSGNIIAMEDGYTKTKSIWQTRLADGATKGLSVYFEDFNTDVTSGTIEFFGSCTIGAIMPDASSKETYMYQGPQMGPADKASISAQFKFSGFSYRVCETKDTSKTSTETCQAKPFTATIQFKGNATKK